MRREKRNNNNLEDKVKWGKLVSFIIAIILLIIAIVASMSSETTVGNLNYNRTTNEHNSVESASSDLSKNVNQVLKQNTIGGDNAEEDDNEINEIKESLTTNNVVANNVVSSSNNTNEVGTEEKEVSANLTETQFIFPVEGEVIKEFAKDNLIYSETLEEWITHTGIDIKADRTTVVKATAEGTVKSIKNDPRYGLTIVIEHNDEYQTVYSNLLTSEFVVEGESVEKGQSIGTVGNSAVFEIADEPHLHFEILKNSVQVDPSIYIK